jgi:hypothetical protein
MATVGKDDPDKAVPEIGDHAGNALRVSVLGRNFDGAYQLKQR